MATRARGLGSSGRLVGLWVAMAVVMINAVVCADMSESPVPYKYESPPPPEYEAPPAPENWLPPPYNRNEAPNNCESLKAVVTGHVYCDVCRNGKMKQPLKDVKVGVFCWNGESEDSFYGVTEENGLFKIELTNFNYEKWGGKACQAKLIAAFYETTCTIPTTLHGGDSGAELHIKSKSEKEVVLLAGPFAYLSEQKYEKCDYEYASPPPPPYYKYESPPPYMYESPPYKYESPPPYKYESPTRP